MRRHCAALSAVTVLAVICPEFVLSAEEPSLYEQARSLYREGPEKAPQIIELLQRELKQNPENDKAIRLLAITYFGTGQFERALEQFDASLGLAEKRKELSPRMLFYKARTLYELKRHEDARKILDTYWAFWQDDEDLKGQFEVLYSQVMKQLQE